MVAKSCGNRMCLMREHSSQNEQSMEDHEGGTSSVLVQNGKDPKSEESCQE